MDWVFVINIILVIISVGLAVMTWRDAENKKNQVKIWMQDANGLQDALRRVVIDNLDGRYSSTKDMGNTIWSLQAMAFALYQSLYEERCLKEKDFIKEQKELRDEIKKMAKKNQKEKKQQGTHNTLASPAIPIGETPVK